jgi:CheY-like chemotaxis protein
MQTLPNTVLQRPGLPPGLCILVVEDDDADTYLIGRALEDNPAVGRMFHARDGIEALGMVERGEVSPDLILIDLHMPRMDGFDLLSALSRRPDPGFPMMVLTSSSSPTDAIRSRLRSAIRVVTKPDTVAEMYSVLKTAIEAICRPGKSDPRPGRTPEYLLVGSPRPVVALRRGGGGDDVST